MAKVATRRLMLAAASLAGLAALGACGDSGGDSAAAAADGPVAVVIDVRTPEEFAAGHLDGALNVDIQAADFDARIGELDPAASYVVYCRSGNRAATAIARMAEIGIADAVNAGSVEQAARHTGLPVVD